MRYNFITHLESSLYKENKPNTSYNSLRTKLASTGDLHSSGYLTAEDFPEELSVGIFTYTITYFNGLSDQLGNPFNTSSRLGLDIAIRQAFTISNSSILILSENMVALYKCQSGKYAYLILIQEIIWA